MYTTRRRRILCTRTIAVLCTGKQQGSWLVLRTTVIGARILYAYLLGTIFKRILKVIHAVTRVLKTRRRLKITPIAKC